MKRVIAYIDGFNLYFGLRDKGWRKYYWLDLCALSSSMLKGAQTLEAVHYFTARIHASEDSSGAQRQKEYLEALQTLAKLHIQFGHYLEKPRRCTCGRQWTSYEEKMTDVNIASQMIVDAFDNRFDTALLISADSDLTTPVNIIRTRFPEKNVIIALPPKRRSHKLVQAASGSFVINETAFRRSQLPELITKPDGYTLHRPEHWK